MAEETALQITLPGRLVSSVDLSRTIRELEAVDDSLRQAQLRKAGEPTQLARTSMTLEELAKLNNLSLIDQNSRTQMIAMLKAFSLHAPRIHVSLAAEPSGKFVQRIVVWLRKNISPILLVEIGLQPTLAAGCQIRTTNKIFDLSLRHRFTENRHMLVEKIGETSKPEPVAETVPTQAAPSASAATASSEAAPAQTAPTQPGAAA